MFQQINTLEYFFHKMHDYTLGNILKHFHKYKLSWKKVEQEVKWKRIWKA